MAVQSTYVTDHYPPGAYRYGDALTGTPNLMEHERVVVTFAAVEPESSGRMCFREASCRELGALVGMIDPGVAAGRIADLEEQVALLQRALSKVRTAVVGLVDL
jgi:hypothetical protein